MSDITQIQVLAEAPAFPLILADSNFLATLSTVEEQVVSLKVIDASSAQEAADLQQRLTSAGKKLDAARLALKRPFIDINAKIDETARAPMARIEKIKDTLKRGLIDYENEQQRIAREAELERQRELARLEKIRLAEEAEAKRKADELAAMLAAQTKAASELAAKSNTPIEDVDFGSDDPEPVQPPPKTVTEIAIEAVRYAPAVVAHKPTGVRYKTVVVPVLDNINNVPEVFVIKTPNMQAIKATFCVGYKEGAPLPVCPGIKFEAKKEVDSTGRAR